LPRNNGQSFITGLFSGFAIAIGAVLLLSPEARQKTKPLFIAGVKKASQVVDNLRSATARAVEDFEDIVAEAKYEAVKTKVGENISELISRENEEKEIH
jgi:gas vesicle protein